MARAVYLAVFLGLALAAGGIYYLDTREVTVVLAAADLRVGATVSEASLTTRRVHPGDVPPGAILDVADAVGRVVAWPVLDGQYIPRRALTRNRAALIGGLSVPPGYHAISVPVTAVEAVGGELRPGDLVDVLAVVRNQQPGTSPAPATVLGRRVLVLGLRTEQGQPVDTPAGSGGRGPNFSGSRIAGVVLAIAPEDEQRYAAAAAVSSFTVALDLG